MDEVFRDKLVRVSGVVWRLTMKNSQMKYKPCTAVHVVQGVMLNLVWVVNGYMAQSHCDCLFRFV